MSKKLKEKNLSQTLITLTDKLQKALKIKAHYKFTMEKVLEKYIRFFKFAPVVYQKSLRCKNLLSGNIPFDQFLLQPKHPKLFAYPCANLNTSRLHAYIHSYNICIPCLII